MSRRVSLRERCGGRYAFMAAAICEDPDLSLGTFRLYAVMCAHADLDGYCEFCLKILARKLGVSIRTVQNWKRELELFGLVEELHEGDKAIGSFRVIRNPAERASVKIKNAYKVADRAARKTPHANRTSHPRCEPDCAQIKIDQDPLVFPREPVTALPETDNDIPIARQGNQETDQLKQQCATAEAIKPLKNAATAPGPDWRVWIEHVVATQRIPETEAWLWLGNEIDRIAEERGVDKEEAGRILEQQLKIKRRTRK